MQSTKKVKKIFQIKKDFITCSKLIINELGGSTTRSDNVHFANNEQALLVFFTVHGEHNLIVSATRRSRDIKIPLCLWAPVQKSLIL